MDSSVNHLSSSSGSGLGQPLQIALCAEAAPADRVALCAALDLADAGAPEWVHPLRNDVMRTGEGRGPTLRPLPGLVNLFRRRFASGPMLALPSCTQ